MAVTAAQPYLDMLAWLKERGRRDRTLSAYWSFAKIAEVRQNRRKSSIHFAAVEGAVRRFPNLFGRCFKCQANPTSGRQLIPNSSKNN